MAKRGKTTDPSARRRHDDPPYRAVVGVGASAGGLDALIELFEALPGDTGAAYLVAFHLDPASVSHLREILARHTSMPVQEAEDGTAVEADRVYVGLPGRTLTFRGGSLRVERLEERPQEAWSLDALFLSLAEELGPRAVAIVLSGSGAHGVAGAGHVRAAAGLVIAQDPDTAEYGTMPRSVVHAGVADLVLAPGGIPGPLIEYLKHPYLTREEIEEDGEVERLEEALTLIRVRLGHDFRSYKRPTLVRRLRRRLGLSRSPTLEDYVALLRRDEGELRALSEDLTVQVSGFFRDPEMWEVLRERVIAPLVEERPAGAEVRVWVPGCATGEEAYSFALLLAEEGERASKHLELKVFATDTADTALGTARAGLYPAAAVEDLDAERLRRYFTSRGSYFQVRKVLRQTVIFSNHDLLRSPPFSRMDLVSCRNVLIYLVPEVQRKLIGLFHFALREGGALVLGKAESVGERPDLFEPVSKAWRIYRCVGETRHDEVEFPVAGPPARVGVGDEEEDEEGEKRPAARRRPERSRPADKVRGLLLERYAPASVLIDDDFRILYFHGATEDFLLQPRGEPRQNLLALARPGLKSALRRAVRSASERRTRGEPVQAKLRGGSDPRTVQVVAHPVADGERGEPLFLVAFERLEPRPEAEPAAPPRPGEARVEELEGDLFDAQQDLQSTVEELESANEELKASNQEITSMNEELQSMNEELQTSQEELHSMNEELATVNSQLEEKVLALEEATDDLRNLLRSTDIATLFLDTELRIRMFTPRFGRLFEVRPEDAGRPLEHFQPRVDDPGLLDDAREVIESVVPKTAEVRDAEGRWYVRRVLPYRTERDRVEGVVVTYSDVTALQEARRELAGLNRELELRVEERTGLVQVLQDVTGIANTAGSVVEALERALARIAPRDGWDVGHVYWVAETGEIEPSAIWYQEPGSPDLSGFKAQTAAQRLAPGEGLVGRVIERKEPEWVSDFEAEPGRLLRDVAGTGLRSAIAFPLLVEREVVGVIEFFSSKPIEPVPDQLVVMASIGIQLGQVVERSRAERRLADLTVREQQRLGEELHEGLSQQVTGLAMLARSLHRRLVDRDGEEVDLAAELVENLETARSQVRDLSKGLVSQHLGARSVVEALEELAEEACRTYQVDCWVEAEEGLEIAEGRLATALYRIGREALNNALVHARPKTVVIRLGRGDGRVVLEVEDDGVGLPEDFETRGGLGLRIMRDRAAMLGGEVRLEPRAGGGARVRCVLPERAGRGG